MTNPIKIKMFTKTVCPTCKIAKQQLSFLPVDVDIEEINIDNNTIYGQCTQTGEPLTAQEYLINVLDSMATPTFEFESGRIIRGYNEGEIREELKL
ncbi:glutaredoxin family protein [Bacillus cereus]|uniref:glutaredoxin family protein n=1 Tax=Bacillus cereus TaxID=1396 RepID=UPI000BF26D13|nr:glutaredoxin domain-containing protein [Bacillus cereus]PFQ13480.1 hypothetical protein COK14_09000 [Bacillus cereus]